MDSVIFKKSAKFDNGTQSVADQITALMPCCFKARIAQQQFNQLWFWKENRNNYHPPDDAEILWADQKGMTFLESRNLDELYELDCFGFCFISQIVLPLKPSNNRFGGEFRMSVVKEALGLNPQLAGSERFGKADFYCEFRDGSGPVTDQEVMARLLVDQYPSFFTEISKIIGGSLELAKLGGD